MVSCYILFIKSAGIQSSSLSDNLTLSIFSTVSDSLIVFVRKSAHISEFFILALLMYNVFKDYFTINKSFLLILIFSILYACIDEIHQIFIIGRECLVRDVFIDAIGIIIALILIKVYITCKK